MMNEIFECGIETFRKYEIDKEMGNLMSFLGSNEWVDIADHGTKQEFIDGLGDAVDPITEKIMGAYGPDVIGGMPTEMHQWIKDSTILWIKNKGSGNIITEDDIIKDANTLNNRNTIKEIKNFYEEKITKLT